jgi:hypothetical protein
MTTDASELLPWTLTGNYLEACNCEVICPCRRIGGRSGGRSSYGVCMGALAWAVTEGSAGAVDLGGRAAVLACRYDDDEPGSPWTFFLYVDDGGSADQQEALARVLTGALGGTPQRQFPWVWKESHMLGWQPAPIEIEHAGRRAWFRAGEQLTVRMREPVAEQEPVTCVIPGHHRSGEELNAELLQVRSEPPLTYEFRGRCGYRSTFAYSSD